jgi:DsbC/DsbD-like thiol-disulfide interchange protein
MLKNIGILATLTLLAALSATLPSAAQTASDWIEGFNNKIRLLAGSAARPGGEARPYAAIEIEMPPGWKTYWRAPGEAGGIPPEFDFSGSENLARATVLYPAPKKLADKAGVTFGYKDHVIFPVAVDAQEKARPVLLKVRATYGVCKELCVPAEAELSISVTSNPAEADAIAQALAHVPTANPTPGKDPVVENTALVSQSGKPFLKVSARATDAGSIDAFVDSPDGIYLPAPKKISNTANQAIFDVDLTDGVDVKDLKGKSIIITLTTAGGQSETTIPFPESGN